MDVEKIIESFRQFIREKGLRYTVQREEVLREFLKSGGHMTIEDLYLKLRKKNPGIGFSTVYRTIKLLEEAGIATRLSFDERAEPYESTVSGNHHDHMICIRCKKVIEFFEPRIEKIQDEIARKHSFNTLSHRLEIFGLCDECARKNE